MRALLQWLNAAFHQRYSRTYAVTQGIIGVLIVVSVGLLVAEPLVPANLVPSVALIDRLLLVVFAFEIVLRIASVRPPELEVYRKAPLGIMRAHIVARVKHVFEPLVLVDIVTVLALVPALRGLRAIRLVRLVRSLRIFRYSDPFTSIVLPTASRQRSSPGAVRSSWL